MNVYVRCNRCGVKYFGINLDIEHCDKCLNKENADFEWGVEDET